MPNIKKLLTAAAGTAAAGSSIHVDDVFSTHLYEGTGSSLAINNGLDLSGEGGLVWLKGRDGAYYHKWYDTERGIQYAIESNTTDANQTEAQGVTAVGSNGFTLGTDGNTNSSGASMASWSFRKAAGFFDIVTYTGNGTAGRTVAHSLGSVPRMMIVKNTTTSRSWAVYHTSLAGTKDLALDDAGPAQARVSVWNNTNPTSSVFTVGSSFLTNTNGDTYVAYLFGDDAVFGEDGNEQICKIGSYTGTGSDGNTITLGFEPQWLLWKCSTANGNWQIVDCARHWTDAGVVHRLEADTSDSEAISGSNYCKLISTGFIQNGSSTSNNGNGETYAYMAIRRPTKIEDGSSIFEALAYTGNGPSPDEKIISNTGKGYFDLFYNDWRTGGSTSQANIAFYRINNLGVDWNSTNSALDISSTHDCTIDSSLGFKTTTNNLNLSSHQRLAHGFRRKPKVMDIVTYTGTGSNLAVSHNLKVAPELMISIDNTHSYSGKQVASSHLSSWGKTVGLDNNYAASNNTAVTATSTTSITMGSLFSGNTYVYTAILFATYAGISKVGTYSGNGSSQTINCSLNNAPRFILIRRTDSGNNEGTLTSHWWYWDYVLGISAGSEYVLSYSDDVAQATADSLDTTSSGFSVTNDSVTAINTSGGTYLYLAIA